MTVRQEEAALVTTPVSPLRRVGIREFKQHTSEIVRYVEEQRLAVEVSRRGVVVARVEPVRPAVDIAEERAAREARWQALSDEATRLWPDGVSAVDAIRDVRDDGWS